MLVREKGDVEWADADLFTRSKCEDFVAEKFAEYCYYQDPGDPNDFEMVVEVLNDKGELKTFDVSAMVEVYFNADEREEDDEHA